MTYPELNKHIYNQWLSFNQGSTYFLFLYDEDIHQEFLSQHNITELEFDQIIIDYGKLSWRNYILEINGLSQIFGIISLQLLVASKMTNSFNEILAKKLSCTIENLQSIYGDYQELIWEKAKNIIESIGYKTSIPDRKSYKGRFIQYPDSQSFLKINDLETFSQIFIEKGLHPEQNWKYLDFKKELEFTKILTFKNRYLTNNFKRKINSNDISSEILFHQIYNYFNLRWDSTVGNKDERNSKDNFKLFFEKGTGFKLLLNDTEYIDLSEEANLRMELFNRTNLLNHSKELILEYSEQWNDYTSTKKVNRTSKIIYLTFDKNSFICRKLIESNKEPQKMEGAQSYLMFFIDLSEAELGLFYKYITSQENKLELINGIPLTRGKYMLGYGPKFLINEETMIFINGELQKFSTPGESIDCSKFPVGQFIIQVNDERKFTFQIIPKIEIENPIILQNGWSLPLLTFGGDDLIGHLVKSNEEIISPRLFIKHHQKGNKMCGVQYNNIVLKNLRNQIR